MSKSDFGSVKAPIERQLTQGMNAGNRRGAVLAMSELISCPRCKSPLTSGDAMCDVCGAVLDRASTGSESVRLETIVCLLCGSRNPVEAQHCSGCKRPLGQICPRCERYIERISGRCTTCGGNIPQLKLQVLQEEIARNQRQGVRTIHRRRILQAMFAGCALAAFGFGGYLLRMRDSPEGWGFVFLGIVLSLFFLFASQSHDENMTQDK